MASYPEVIPPGQVGVIEAQIDTNKLSGNVGRGVTVYTNDPERPKAFLTIRAVVVGGVTLLPNDSLILANHSEQGRKRSLLVRPEANEDAELLISDLEVSAPWLKVEATRIDEPRGMQDGTPAAEAGDWLLTVTVDSPAPYGRFTEMLTFSTGLSRQPTVEVPIAARVLPPVTLSEERLVLPSGDAQARTVLLTVRRGLDPTALEVASSNEQLTTRLEPAGSRGYKLHVAWESAAPPEGEITFRVGAEEFRLPVVAR